MKKLICCLLVLTLTALCAGCKKKDPALEQVKEAGVFTVALRAESALCTLDEAGNPGGFDVELAEAVGKQLGVAVSFQQVTLDEGIALLQNGRADCLWGGVTAEEASAGELTASSPYLMRQQCLVTMADKAKSYSNLEEFTAMRLAVISGEAGEQFALEKLPGARQIKAASAEEALTAVAQGEADAAILDLSLAGMQTGEGGAFPTLGVCDNVQLPKAVYVVCVSPASGLLSSINSALAKLEADGTIAALADKYHLTGALIAG